MNLSEKLYQKLNNLKSKNEIKDFFIIFNDLRKLKITFENGSASKESNPTSYSEISKGNFLIIWDDNYYSKGEIGGNSINNFEDFFSQISKLKIHNSSDIFIPEKGIYPLAISYSKTLADMIDIPEYLLKISDIYGELSKMINIPDSSCIIEAQEGTRYAYSSLQMDENFSYTFFKLKNKIDGLLEWDLMLSEALSIAKLEDFFSFLGDISHILKNNNDTTAIPKNTLDIILPPKLFKKVFIESIVENLNGNKILSGESRFNIEQFKNKEKILGTLSLSYDPLMPYHPGTYKFTSYGSKAQKEYFVKFGKLNSPALDNFNYKKLGYKSPTIEIYNFSNLKFEGIKKIKFEQVKSSLKPALFFVNGTVEKCENLYVCNSSQTIYTQGGKMKKTEDIKFEFDIIETIQKADLELVEFTDGQYGCKISNVTLEKIK